jgi:hypothetical protein
MLRSKCTANTPPATNTAASSNKTSRPIHFMGVSVWAMSSPLGWLTQTFVEGFLEP